VFHFMVEPADREGYLHVLRKTLRPGGHVILATFGPQGPTQCSGLPVERLSSTLGDHRTPSGRSQQFHYAHLRQRANADAT
jgi:hypothetical protein